MSQVVDRALKKNSWLTKTVDSLQLNQSPLLASCSETLVHAFTTRHAGNTPAPADSFNLGRHRDTDESRQDAATNRQKLCQVLGLDFSQLAVPAQVHSAEVVIADERQTYAQVDGIATNERGKPILLHFADCVPVMIFDRKQKVLCIVHAGWKGTAGSIARNGVLLMQNHYGCQPSDMVAAVGPAIGSCCYPTAKDVADKLSLTVRTPEELIVWNDKRTEPRPDLKAFNALQLLEAGVGEVDVADLCTACNPDIFYSHRQSGGDTGRQGAIASIA